MAVNCFDDHGIRFEYPRDWELEITDEDAVVTVSVQSPGGLAFAMVTTDATCPAPAEIADEALRAMREEYPVLDAFPALETIGGQRAVGHDIEFMSLDMTNSAAIRCFRTPRRTILVFGQWSDIAEDDSESLVGVVRRTLEETDA